MKTQQVRSGLSSLRSRATVLFTCVPLLLSAGCFAPGFVRLANKPSLSTARPKNDKKVVLIVRDQRPDAIQKTNMCGVNHQTIFMIPAAPIFLAHLEHLDSIISHHMTTRLEHNVYEVLLSYPKA